MSALLQVNHLSVSFQMGRADRVDAVRSVSFEVPENTAVALVGESGSGKSVTALSIVRLLPDNACIDAASQIVFEGRELLAATPAQLRALRGRAISFIFQEPMNSLNPVYTVGNQIAEVLQRHVRLSRRAALARAAELLHEVGIAQPQARLQAYPHELSGGQQQRVMIAMAIACEPKLLIADEPTTALDVTVQRQILDLLARLQSERRMSMLFISHDLAVVGEVAQHVVVMRNGQVRESAPVARIFDAPQDAYTRALLACRSRVDARAQRLPVVEDFLTPVASGVPITTATRPVRPPDAEPLMEAKGLTKTYWLRTGLFSREPMMAAQDVSFKLYRGRTLGVVGESGSGKTTVGMMLTQLTEPTSGVVSYLGKPVMQLDGAQRLAYRRKVQIIFQNPYASLNPRFTVGHILTEPMRVHGVGADEAERLERAMVLARKVGLTEDAIGKYPHEFSGGQRQRIAIARVLSVQPEVIVCDESVSALDVSVQATVLNLLLDLQEEFHLTYVFISHDLAVVRFMADELLVMHEGRVLEQGLADAIYAAPEHAYTKQLLSAIPQGYVAQEKVQP
ncbi:MAG TPA: ABC transporter ATP-binding protein [Burkholderiaceae bacterium]|nr:ABC transporter ATP-binding protein [Burkholderiaceae bacterium]